MPEQDPLVTVVTPSFNQGHFIRATIESVLSQNYPRLEYIVMDGGSTDQTAAVAAEYSSRLTFISEKDRGQSHAINKGFRMAQGSLLAWLNSDDIYLPGAVRAAVEGFRKHPSAGAVYGEGFLIDYDGNSKGRFPCTEPFDLWKLTYLSDYILQQTVFFRKDVLDDVGLLGEDLHYTMDWDILIRIGLKYGLACLPDEMGCLREYPAAKSSAGGMERVREIRAMLRRHTGMSLAPGAIVYGLDTVHQLACQRVDDIFGPRFTGLARKAKLAIRLAAGLIISRTSRHSQGIYSDGWAGPVVRYMLPPSPLPILIEGSLPDALFGQRIYVLCNGRQLRAADLPDGPFSLTVPVPEELATQPLNIEIRANRSILAEFYSLSFNHRRVAYFLNAIRRAD